MKTIKQWFLKSKKELIIAIFLLIISLGASWALLNSGFIPTHDGEYHILRFYEFDKMIKAGVWFPRWAEGLNKGFGVPLFNFVYPLPNYLGEFFHLSGFSFIDAFKLTMAFGYILSSFTFYVLLRYNFSIIPSFLGAVFYLLAPYHLVDVYVRGSVGEVWSLAIAPLVLYFGVSKKYILYAITLTLLILSHNILGLMFVVFIVIFLFIRMDSWKVWLTTLLGLGLSAFFWLPALVEKKYVTGLEQINFANHFPQVWQLIFPSWGTGFSDSYDLGNQMSFQIGMVHLLMLVVFVFYLLRKKIEPRFKRIVAFLLAILMLVLFLMNSASLPIWKIVPLLSFFQFPWRFLSLVIFIISFLTAWVLQVSNSKKLAVLVFVFALVFYWPYTKPVVYGERLDDYYLNNPVWTKGTDSPGNSFNTIWFKGALESNDKLSYDGRIVRLETKNILPISYTYQFDTVNDTQVVVNTAYFPGWSVFIDDKEQKVYLREDGLFSFNLPKGQYKVEVKFVDTPVRKWAKYISLLSLISLILQVKKHENRI